MAVSFQNQRKDFLLERDLSPKGLLLTRPFDDSFSLFQKVRFHRHHYEHRQEKWHLYLQPLLKIVPVAFNPKVFENAKHVILTSKNALEGVAPFLDKDVTLWCVGQQTAAACRYKGFFHLEVADGSGKSLFKLIQQKGVKDRFLHPSGEDVTFDFEKAPKISCQRMIVYKTLPVESLRPAVLRAFKKGRISHVVLFSKKTAEVLKELTPLPASLHLLVLSQPIADVFPRNPFTIIKSEDDIPPLTL